MIEPLLTTLVNGNPVLTAGIGTVLFGSLMYVIRGIPTWILATVRRVATIQLDLNSESGPVPRGGRLLSRHRVALFARLYTTDLNGQVVAGYGTSFALWHGTPDPVHPRADREEPSASMRR